MTRFGAAVKWLLQTDIRMLGQIHVASAKRAAQSFRRPSTPCTNGTESPKFALFTWHMYRLILGQKAATEKFRKTKWFTRGWALQELIAPQSVIFFDQDWGELDTQENHRGLISEIMTTNETIPTDTKKIVSVSVAQRMSYKFSTFEYSRL
jgi:hypothetical protein